MRAHRLRTPLRPCRKFSTLSIAAGVYFSQMAANLPKSTRSGAQLSERLNRDCFCVTLGRQALYSNLEREAVDPDFSASLVGARQHLSMRRVRLSFVVSC